ncbi:MAG TPA: flagellar basal body rod C-terminal domain-containing protein, partial [Dissulfurispiraceae bacterium]|nr:flagellar basal body rod C-terminal domain-containing protein [Dissulfurispiraceae bacterium]
GASATGSSSVYSVNAGDNVGDNGNARLIADLINQTIVSGVKPLDYYQSIVSDIGVKASSAKTSSNAQQTVVDQLEQRRQEFSGVSLDEEAANLLKFQKSYEAGAKMITVADDLLTSLLNLVGK